jgi:hypothetical protein
MRPARRVLGKRGHAEETGSLPRPPGQRQQRIAACFATASNHGSARAEGSTPSPSWKGKPQKRIRATALPSTNRPALLVQILVEMAKTTFTPAIQTVVAADIDTGSITPVPEPGQNPALTARCQWCGKAFEPRRTGGSAQKFCCARHRQQFWAAARRWTMWAIEMGLLYRSIA